MLLTSSSFLHYQRFLKEKFQEIERSYYCEIAELTQKLYDIDLPGWNSKKLPDFSVTQFSFVENWEDGRLSSADVLDIFVKMKHQDQFRVAARAKVIKPIQKFMLDNPVVADFVKHTLASLESDTVPLMIKYLEIMNNMFTGLTRIDSRQIPITWVEQTFYKGEIRTATEEMTLNQVIHQIESFVVNVSERFLLNDMVVVFDQVESMDERTIHWIFAPQLYISLLQSLFDIKVDSNRGIPEKNYLRNIIRDVL